MDVNLKSLKEMRKHLHEDESGQAIFELLIFMPILIFFYTIIFNVGNSINVSINQQKVTRRYFYHLTKQNSFVPNNRVLENFKAGFTRAGIAMVGFADRLDGGGTGSPIGPCFKFNSFFASDNGETCEDPTSGERQTSFVRVYTAYGVCGESYSLQGNRWFVFNSSGPGVPDPKSKYLACSVSN